MNLVEAAWNGEIESVRDAIAIGVDVEARNEMGWNALMGAAMNGHIEIAEMLLECGADVNAHNLTTTSLMLAAANGHADMVRLLVRHGADLNATDRKGNTVGKYASSRGQTDIVELLEELAARDRQLA